VIVEELYQKKLQLLRDVDTRWSSTHLMIKRALEIKDVCNHILLNFLYWQISRQLKGSLKTMAMNSQSLKFSHLIHKTGKHWKSMFRFFK